MPVPCSLLPVPCLYCVTGSAGVFGGFRCGAFGGAAGLGGLAETDGGGKPDPFLTRTSPTSVLRLIFAAPPPTVNAIFLLSPSGTLSVYSVTMSPLWVNALTDAEALGGSVNS